MRASIRPRTSLLAFLYLANSATNAQAAFSSRLDATMVLLVKLKKPPRSDLDGGLANQQESGDQFEERDAVRAPVNRHASSSPVATFEQVDAIAGRDDDPGSVDALADALEQTAIHERRSIPPATISTDVAQLDAPKDERKEASASPSTATTRQPVVNSVRNTLSDSTGGVDVFLAPAVLGHRWVRSRSTAYIVERPERLRASLLGVAALLGKVYDAESRRQARNGLNAMTDRLAALNVDSSKGAPDRLNLILSRTRIALDSPNKGLSMVHALEEEYLSTDDMGSNPPAFAMASASSSPAMLQSWPKAPSSYSAYLRALCHLAPEREPAPPAPRTSTRQTTKGGEIAKEDELHTIESADGARPSEVPVDLPQGDLYLCGIQSQTTEKAEYFAHALQRTASDDTAPTTPSEGADALIDLPHTPHRSAQDLTGDAQQSTEADWLRDGSLGAIESSMGACCAALDRVVEASRGDVAKGSEASPNVRDLHAIHMANLEQGAATHTANSVDVVDAPGRRAFVLARPPGHHCSATRPSGFCWVNNVSVMALHAFAAHGIDRIAVLDFDLHHGDGTQSIVWRVNAQTAVEDADRAARLKALAAEREALARHRGPHRPSESHEATATEPRGLKMFYGSLHDIESFPCEDGDKDKVSDASMCVEGAHGQWIWNVHLEAHADRDAFATAYDTKYAQLFAKARRFFRDTDATASTSLIILSAGFDASIHELPGMQRHGKSVPPQFYTRFTRDAVALADEQCDGKCVSVLEGGYSDRALTTGVAAHLIGLTGGEEVHGEELCEPATLVQLDRLSKITHASMAAQTGDSASAMTTMGVGGGRRRQELSLRDPDWLKFALEAFKRLQECCGLVRLASPSTAPSTPVNSAATAGGSADWRTPRETRSSRAIRASAKKASPVAQRHWPTASPLKEQQDDQSV